MLRWKSLLIQRAREGQRRDAVDPLAPHASQQDCQLPAAPTARNRVNPPSGACHSFMASPVPSQHFTSCLENEERC